MFVVTHHCVRLNICSFERVLGKDRTVVVVLTKKGEQ